MQAGKERNHDLADNAIACATFCSFRSGFGRGVMVAAVIVRWAVLWLDQRTGWAWLDFTVDGAREVLGGLASSMLTFIVFALSALLLDRATGQWPAHLSTLP